MQKLEDFFSDADKQSILVAINAAESMTSGEIKVRIERNSGGDPMKTARKAFNALGMRKTKLHNGVLFVLAVEDRTFVILGDDGINAKVPEGFWNNVKDTVLQHFSTGNFASGLTAGIKLAGEQLATFFPHDNNDVNELADAISYSE
jgi:uncharacterized membrane protein